MKGEYPKKSQTVKVVWSARIVLVLRFHRTLATPEPFRGLLQSTISTKDPTQTKLLAAYNSIMSSIITKRNMRFIQKCTSQN